MITVEHESVGTQESSSLQLKGIDYVEFYVGNAYQAAHFYRMAFGFRLVAYADLETGLRDRVSFVLEQGDIRLVLSSAMDIHSPIVQHVSLHGDGVKDVAITVDDATRCFKEAMQRGARPVLEPTVFADSQ